MINNEENNIFDDDKFHNIYYVEKGENVAHFIFVNEFSDNHIYYNTPVINFIRKRIAVVMKRDKFSLIDECKDFLVKVADEIMEQNIKKENLITEGKEEENFNKIVLTNTKEINLKSYAVNEVGLTFRNDSDEPKYSCYIDLEANKLYIQIELPGGGSNIDKNYEVKGSYNFLTFEGEKSGDKQLEVDDKNEKKKLYKIINKRKKNKFKFHIEIPNSFIQIIPEDPDVPKNAGIFVMNEDSKGILTAVYNIVNLNQKKGEKNEKKKFSF